MRVKPLSLTHAEFSTVFRRGSHKNDLLIGAAGARSNVLRKHIEVVHIQSRSHRFDILVCALGQKSPTHAIGSRLLASFYYKLSRKIWVHLKTSLQPLPAFKDHLRWRLRHLYECLVTLFFVIRRCSRRKWQFRVEDLRCGLGIWTQLITYGDRGGFWSCLPSSCAPRSSYGIAIILSCITRRLLES